MTDDAVKYSVQPRATDEGETPNFFYFLVQNNELIPPWWSSARDMELRRFWRTSDHLSGAMYSFISKIKSIPFQVVPRDKSIKRHNVQAEIWTDRIKSSSDFGGGWGNILLPKFLEDYHGTDNGGFIEVIGPGRPDGPIVGEVVGIAHLDSTKCVRCADPMYPIIYMPPKGGRYKLHYTRVAYASQLPSADEEMHNVGFCSVSRAVNTAQTLIDILNYQQEKLGSKPQRSIIVTSGGLDPVKIGKSLELAWNASGNRGQSRYMPTTIVGDPGKVDGALTLIDTASIPDGFDYEKSLTLGMAVIALAFGTDARELFPMSGSGATRADALIQHIKQRGKGPGETLQTIENLFNQKILPPYLKMVFDLQDDAQDRQEAEIDNIRAQRRESDIVNGVTTIRVEREIMVEDGEITEAQFEQLELESGRLADGTPILTLFKTDDEFTKRLLDVGVENPTDTASNDKTTILIEIEARQADIMRVMNGDNARDIKKARRALAALEALERMYRNEKDPDDEIEQPQDVQQQMPSQDLLAAGDEEENAMSDDLQLGLDSPFMFKSKDTYFRRLKNIVRGLWAGEIDEANWFDLMDAQIRAGMREAWIEGAKAVGVNQDEFTQEELIAIDEKAFNQLPFLPGFGSDIVRRSKENGFNLAVHDARIELWANRWNEAFNDAKLSARDNPKLEWELGATEEHCPSCSRLNGKVKRQSYWKERGIQPQNGPNPMLKCEGWGCDCQLTPTDKPISKGPLPNVP